jgi:hypothetical protein
LNPVLGRVFSFNDVAGLGILEQQERGGARQQVARHVGDDCAGTFREVGGNERLELVGAENERAEFRCAREVVPDTVTR